MLWLMCKVLTTVAAARERPDTLRKAASVNPSACHIPPTPVQKATAALGEQHRRTQQRGAKARGCKHQQRETALGELPSALPQEPEPVSVSCPPKHHCLFPNTCKTLYLVTALNRYLKAGEDDLRKGVCGWNKVAVKPPSPPPWILLI